MPGQDKDVEVISLLDDSEEEDSPMALPKQPLGSKRQRSRAQAAVAQPAKPERVAPQRQAKRARASKVIQESSADSESLQDDDEPYQPSPTPPMPSAKKKATVSRLPLLLSQSQPLVSSQSQPKSQALPPTSPNQPNQPSTTLTSRSLKQKQLQLPTLTAVQASQLPDVVITTTQPVVRSQSRASDTCWLDKHVPVTEADLAVAKKKLAELRTWMESQLPAHRKLLNTPRLLSVTGPPGCGKSTAVRVLAAELGFEVLEWHPTTVTLWNELQYQQLPLSRDLGPAYVSKLDDFAAFVSRAKYPSLRLEQCSTTGGAAGGAGEQGQGQGGSEGSAARASIGAPPPLPPPTSNTTGPPPPKLLLLDDLPHAHDAARRAQLTALVLDLLATARCPVVLIVTETTGGAAGNAGFDADASFMRDLQGSLQVAGAGTLAFNAITVNAIIKVLLGIAQAEGVALSGDAAAGLAAAADGDLRNAIHNLQAMFYGEGAQRKTAAKGRRSHAAGSKTTNLTRGKGAGGAGKQLQPHEAARLSAVQRDLGLQLFHALGKILYNKRDVAVTDAGDGMMVIDSDEEQQPGGSPARKAQQAGKRGVAPGGRGGGKASKVAAAAPVGVLSSVAGAKGAALPGSGGLMQGLPSLAFTEQLLPQECVRPPMRYAPEEVVMRAGLEPLPTVAFLHANYLQFMGEQELEDTTLAAAYLSDAAFMSCYRSSVVQGYLGGYWGEEETTATNLTAACACSVATRGLLYTNRHPAPNRFRAMQGSSHSHVDKAVATNLTALNRTSQLLTTTGSTFATGLCGSHVAEEVLPSIRPLSAYPSHAWLQRTLPDTWHYYADGQVHVHKQASGGTSQAAGADQLVTDFNMSMVITEEGEAQGEQGQGQGEGDPIEDD